MIRNSCWWKIICRIVLHRFSASLNRS